MLRQLLAAASAVLLVAAVACDNDDESTNANPVGQESQAQQGRSAPEEQNLKTRTIEIQERDVNPRQMQIQANEAVQLQIKNTGKSACTFFLGSYVAALQVPAGETVKQSLTLPQEGSSETVSMGCDGDTSRQGKAVIQFRGVNPGEGR